MTDDPRVEAYRAALLAADEVACAAAVAGALDEWPDPIRVMTELVEPALVAVGDAWAEGRLGVADEHLRTAIAEIDLATIRSRLRWGPTDRGHAVVAVVDGEAHLLGAQILADALRVDGWQVTRLATATPVEELAAYVEQHRPSLVLLSASTPSRAPALRASIGAVSALADPPRVFCGGAGSTELVGDAAVGERVAIVSDVQRALVMARADVDGRGAA